MTGSPMRTGRRSATSFVRWSSASRSLLIAFGSSSGLNRARQRHPNRAEICHIVQHVVFRFVAQERSDVADRGKADTHDDRIAGAVDELVYRAAIEAGGGRPRNFDM